MKKPVENLQDRFNRLRGQWARYALKCGLDVDTALFIADQALEGFWLDDQDNNKERKHIVKGLIRKERKRQKQTTTQTQLEDEDLDWLSAYKLYTEPIQEKFVFVKQVIYRSSRLTRKQKSYLLKRLDGANPIEIEDEIGITFSEQRLLANQCAEWIRDIAGQELC